MSAARRRRRTGVLVVGVLLLLAGGGTLLLAADQASTGGYSSSPEYRFTSTAAVLKTDEIDVGADRATAADPNPDLGELARVRIVVRPVDPDARLFVGVGSKRQVEAYLRGIEYDEFDGARLDPFEASFRRVPGEARTADPGRQSFWVATSAGSGTRTLEWDKTGGAWSAVVIRLDGAGMDAHASVGLRFGFLLPAGTAVLIAGTAALLLSFAGRGRERRAAA